MFKKRYGFLFSFFSQKKKPSCQYHYVGAHMNHWNRSNKNCIVKRMKQKQKQNNALQLRYFNITFVVYVFHFHFHFRSNFFFLCILPRRYSFHMDMCSFCCLFFGVCIHFANIERFIVIRTWNSTALWRGWVNF